MEESIFRNQTLIIYMQDLTQLFFLKDKNTEAQGTFMMRKSMATIEHIILNDSNYKQFDKQI